MEVRLETGIFQPQIKANASVLAGETSGEGMGRFEAIPLVPP